MSRLLDHVSPIVQEEDNQCFVARGLKSQTKMHELLHQINVRKLFDVCIQKLGLEVSRFMNIKDIYLSLMVVIQTSR